MGKTYVYGFSVGVEVPVAVPVNEAVKVAEGACVNVDVGGREVDEGL